ncbi:MAG: immunity 26/phosphotriesterase HocA family protein [Actinobacteria bacterium]|nr:immunity 26/phosphotriesterase HocA family protein [Actinomycetota bacterium]
MATLATALGTEGVGVTVKLRDGDVFSIPLGDGRAGLGQIVGHYGTSAYFFAIFESVLPEQEIPIKFQDLLSGPVKLLALSMDAKLHVGDWKVVATTPIGRRLLRDAPPKSDQGRGHEPALPKDRGPSTPRTRAEGESGTGTMARSLRRAAPPRHHIT